MHVFSSWTFPLQSRSYSTKRHGITNISQKRDKNGWKKAELVTRPHQLGPREHLMAPQPRPPSLLYIKCVWFLLQQPQSSTGSSEKNGDIRGTPSTFSSPIPSVVLLLLLPPAPPPLIRWLPACLRRGADKDGGGHGDGEPIVRPHAGVDEAAQPRDQRGRWVGVEPGVGVGRGVRPGLLPRWRPFRGPGPGPLLPGDPGADLRLQRHVGGPGADERVRAAGALHVGQHDGERHERVPPGDGGSVPGAGGGVRRVRPLVRVGADVDAAQPPLRPLRHVPRRHQQCRQVQLLFRSQSATTSTTCDIFLIGFDFSVFVSIFWVSDLVPRATKRVIWVSSEWVSHHCPS